MFKRTRTVFLKDPSFPKVITLSLILFFIFLADAILSFWAPTFIEDSFESPFLMGLIMSFSSIVGFGADVILPQIIKGISVRKLLFLSIILSLIFALSLFSATFRPYLAIFLLAMAIWGVYYEFLGFANQQFVSDSVPFKSHSTAWAIISVFKNLAYFLGPLFAGWLLYLSEGFLVSGVIFFLLIALLVFLTSYKNHARPLEIDVTQVNLGSELEHWLVLFRRVWPMVTMSLVLGLIDATFWTTGAVWTEKLSQQSFFGSFFLPFYTLPSLFLGFVVAKWGVFSGKKRVAIVSLLAGGILLLFLGISGAIWLQLFLVLLIATSLSVTYPMVDAVYSDILARMGRKRKHLIGLSNSTISISYIIGPSLAGYVAEQIGEKLTFSVLGILTFFVAAFLFFTTPKKLHLPQRIIKMWD